MEIKFACPSGHRLSCPADRAGKTAKCPKCGVAVTVPQPEADGEASQSGSSKPKPGEIVFLCPNGHRLHGPKKLAGRAGQCPHCNEKFVIPSLEELEAAASAEQESSESAMAHRPTAEEAAELEDMHEVEQLEEIHELEEVSDEPPPPPVDEYMDPGVGEFVPEMQILEEEEVLAVPHPLCIVFQRLWKQRDHEAKVELHLIDKEVVRADRFAPRLSRGTHGVFAAEQEDGRYTLSAIPWEAIARVQMRGVIDLPEEMFD